MPLLLFRRVALFVLLASLAVCGSNDGNYVKWDVVVERRIPLEEPLPHQGPVLVRRGDSPGTLLVAGWGESRIFRIRRDGRWSEVALPDSTLRVANFGSTGDSVWIADDASRRVLILHRESPHYRSILVPTIQPGSQPHVIGVLSDGSVVVGSRPDLTAGDTSVTLIVRVTSSGALVLDSVVEYQREMRLSNADGDREVAVAQPWAYRDIPFVTADGRMLVHLRQSPGSPIAVDVVVNMQPPQDRSLAAVDGRLIRPSRTELTEGTVESWLRSTMQDSLVAFLGGFQRAERELRAALYRPTYLPPARRALSLSAGTLLLERVTTDSIRTWEIWRDDRFAGSFVLSPRVSLQDARDSTIWSVVSSPTGADTILVSRLSARPMSHSRTLAPLDTKH